VGTRLTDETLTEMVDGLAGHAHWGSPDTFGYQMLAALDELRAFRALPPLTLIGYTSDRAPGGRLSAQPAVDTVPVFTVGE
jgi:hypothetical protein